ncbi:hypothetical protein HYALB_00008416 [Hymenoscyphus albidus]|uniref:Uncharacterized protein n=1 Tax=Hymenoscyphus albidus TaxID=595503 RepID=A0A9N9LN41_9HELO|nr:hypothetical protein HYALB_00008416 [Hymenoscyphus albidus]
MQVDPVLDSRLSEELSLYAHKHFAKGRSERVYRFLHKINNFELLGYNVNMTKKQRDETNIQKYKDRFWKKEKKQDYPIC